MSASAHNTTPTNAAAGQGNATPFGRDAWQRKVEEAVMALPRWVRRDLSSETPTVREGAEGWVVAALLKE